MTFEQRLDKLAELGDAEITIGPQPGEELDAFQATVSRLRDYRRASVLVCGGDDAASVVDAAAGTLAVDFHAARR